MRNLKKKSTLQAVVFNAMPILNTQISTMELHLTKLILKAVLILNIQTEKDTYRVSNERITYKKEAFSLLRKPLF
jgi:hypothetical protein